MPGDDAAVDVSDKLAKQVTNWGRWGADDQIGTLNLIDFDAIRRGFDAVKTGRQFSLSLPIRSNHVPAWPERSPAMHFMTIDGGDYALGAPTPGGRQIADDYLFMACQSGTHIDALCHVYTDNLMYNGQPSSEIRSYGARVCGVEQMPSIVTRGVLLDVAASKGVPHLECGYAITSEDLEDCTARQAVEVKPGDALLVNTGWMTQLFAGVDPRLGEPGLGLAAAKWCAAHDVSVVGTDTHGVEVSPPELDGAESPVHIELLRNQGLPLMELVDMRDIVSERVTAFLFIACPLKIKGGTGSPINPIAIV
jgi:kynurenine formamidase